MATKFTALDDGSGGYDIRSETERERLERIWAAATGMEADGPLHGAIISEFIEGAAPFTIAEVQRVAQALIDDIEAFQYAIVEDIAATARKRITS